MFRVLATGAGRPKFKTVCARIFQKLSLFTQPGMGIRLSSQLEELDWHHDHQFFESRFFYRLNLIILFYIENLHKTLGSSYIKKVHGKSEVYLHR